MTLEYGMRAEIRRQSISLFNPSWEHVNQVSQVVHHNIHVPQMTTKHGEYWFWVTHRIWQVRRFTSTKFAHSEDRMYFPSISMWVPHSMVGSGQPDSSQSSSEHSSKQEAASPSEDMYHYFYCIEMVTSKQQTYPDSTQGTKTPTFWRGVAGF